MKWEDYDVSKGFLCEVENKGDFDVALCLMLLPVEAESYLKGEYRWSPEMKNRFQKPADPVLQYGYVTNGVVEENKWVQLGEVVFTGAISVTFSVGATVAAIATMTLF